MNIQAMETSATMDKTDPQMESNLVPCESKYLPEKIDPVETTNKAIEEIQPTWEGELEDN